MGLEKPATVTITNFLKAVQPEGIHYLAYITQPGAPAKHKVYYGPEEAIELASQPYIAKCDTYFALASYLVEKKPVAGKDYMMADRTNQNIDKLKALYIDVDFKAYSNKNAATAAMVAFINDSGMPTPSYIVMSGGGYHMYWALDTAISKADWDPLARGLRELTKDKGLRCDYQVTVDSARILRMPGTRNYKIPGSPRDCFIMGGSQALYSVASMHEVLDGYTVQLPAGMPEGFHVPDNVIQMFAGVNSKQDLTSYPPFYFGHVLTGCAVVASSLARGGAGDEYPLWKNLLHLASFAEDGHEFIHKLSEKGAGYSHESTEARFLESLNAAMNDSRMGPTTCATFSGLSDKCASCPLNGKIKSPAQIRVVEGEDGAKASPEHLDPSFVDKGWTYQLVRTEAKDDESDASWSKKLVLDKAIDQFQYGEDQGVPMIQFSYKNAEFESLVEVKLPELMDIAAMKMALSRAGMVLQPSQANNIQGVILAWLTKLQKTQKHRSRSAFGWVWTDGQPSGFAVNGVVYKPDGSTELSGSVDGHLRDIYTATGDPVVWDRAARIVERDERPEVHLLVASAFASPLMTLGSDANAFTLSFYSRQSGVGKSSNMMLAQAIWGHPKKAPSSLDDTAASVSQKLGKTSSMPGYWDELPKTRVAEFVALMFQSTQGKTRQRLDQRGGLRETFDMSGIMVSNSNDPVLDDVLAYRDGTAGLYRFFQVQMPTRQYSQGNYDPDFEDHIKGLENNFGHAGVKYAQFLAQNIPLVQLTMRKCRELVVGALGSNESERFWRQGLVCILAGTILAERAGIMTLNRSGIFNLFKRLVERGREDCGVVELSVNDLPGDMMFEFQRQLVVLYTLPPRGANRWFTNEVYLAPGVNQPIKLQLAAKQMKLVIPMATVQEYCERRKKRETQIFNVLTDVLGAVRERHTLGTGTSFAQGQSRVWCFVLDAERAMSADDVEKWAARVKQSEDERTTDRA